MDKITRLQPRDYRTEQDLNGHLYAKKLHTTTVVSICSKKRFFSKTHYSGSEFFFKNVNVVFIEKSDFFSKKPPFVTKTFSFQENLHLISNLKRVFPAFCAICMTNVRPKA